MTVTALKELTAEERRAVIDRIAWETIDSSLTALPGRTSRSGRPSNFEEMWKAVGAYVPHTDEELHLPGTWPAFEHAFSNFLHSFFAQKAASFFLVPPNPGFGAQSCTLLAGVTEYLCRRYDLDRPAWVDDSKFFLVEMWALWRTSDLICADLGLVAANSPSRNSCGGMLSSRPVVSLPFSYASRQFRVAVSETNTSNVLMSAGISKAEG